MNKDEYLEKFVFNGLTNLNHGFDAEGTKYFSGSEFRSVLCRVEKLGIGIYGIEPWKNGDLYDVRVCEDYELNPSNPQWYWKAFEAFTKEDRGLLYAATFHVPERLLNEQAQQAGDGDAYQRPSMRRQSTGN
ncbi:hypothetical protein HAHE_06800 [Haloferula helveola]|uniref:Uncharacterized protein n=1 Tax=Haloferula helveola TaxID=490095 RepID=A0ABM7RBL5_9BACT|nr:hypothetical protein HAHE_06800 [Haloferula helveola]